MFSISCCPRDNYIFTCYVYLRLKEGAIVIKLKAKTAAALNPYPANVENMVSS